MIATAIRNDDLHTYEKQKQANAEHCILTAAKIIGPVIENTFSEGMLRKLEQNFVYVSKFF